MPIAEFDDDEDWYDQNSDGPDDDESAPCPECGETVYDVTDKCPSCGYWLTTTDRREMYERESKPLWLKVTAIVLLMALLAGTFGVIVGVF